MILDKENINEKGIIERAFDFFKSKPTYLKIIIIAAVGLLLIFVGTSLADGDSTATDTTLEGRLEELCSSVSGVGRCRVMVSYATAETRYGQESTDIVESVTVVCQGASTPAVKAELVSLLSSLFGIGSNRIYIAKMK